MGRGGKRLLVARGAPTRVAGHSAGSLVPPVAEASCSHCRRTNGGVPLSNTVIHKVLGVQVCGLRVPSARVACAGWHIYVFLGTAVLSKGHSCIAPLNLWLHHQPPRSHWFDQVRCRLSAASFGRQVG
jgi:hypothetical protein